MSRHYTPIADLLPSVFHNDTDSFEQINSYLGLADEIIRAYVSRVEELSVWLSPNGPRNAWPADVPLEAGIDDVLDAYVALFDELAAWTGFTFPEWWVTSVDDGHPSDDRLADLRRRRTYLAKSARLWRRRGTPRGFLDWLCLAFDVAPEHRPYLLEHFKFGRPSCPDDDGSEPVDVGPEPGLRATLLVPSTPAFDRPEMRRLLTGFVETYAPAHVHIRVCWVNDDFELYEVVNDDGTTEVRELPGPRPTTGTAAEIEAWRLAVEEYRSHVRCVLCALVDETSHEAGIGVEACIDKGQSTDRLGIGRLPGGGRVPNDPSPPNP